MEILENIPLLAMLLVVLVVIFYVRKKTSYTLDVKVEPEKAATVSDIVYKKGRGLVVVEFSLKPQEGYAITKWTGTLPRLEGYDSSRWYDKSKHKVRLEIDKNEKMTIHLDQVEN